MRLPSVFVRVFALALCSGQASAATEFTTTVPEDLLREFTSGTALIDLPDDFPEFVMPDGMLPIGSHQGLNQQMVLLRTSRGGAESQRAVVDALRASGGWIDFARPNSVRQTGFVVPARAIEPVSICHEDHGILEILGEDGIENRVYISRRTLPTIARRPICVQLNGIAGRVPPGMGPSPLMQYIPKFDALNTPVEPSAAADPSTRDANLTPPLNTPAIGIRGIPQPPLNSPQLGIRGVPAGRNNTGGPNRSFMGSNQSARFGVIRRDSNSGVQSNALIAAADRPLRTFRRLVADSMESQGWELDSEWNNSDTAVSHWLREGAEGKRILLRLHIARLPEGFYNINSALSELGN